MRLARDASGRCRGIVPSVGRRERSAPTPRRHGETDDPGADEQQRARLGHRRAGRRIVRGAVGVGPRHERLGSRRSLDDHLRRRDGRHGIGRRSTPDRGGVTGHRHGGHEQSEQRHGDGEMGPGGGRWRGSDGTPEIDSGRPTLGSYHPLRRRQPRCDSTLGKDRGSDVAHRRAATPRDRNHRCNDQSYRQYTPRLEFPEATATVGASGPRAIAGAPFAGAREESPGSTGLGGG